MTQTEILEKIRREIDDDEEPYRFEDDDILAMVDDAVRDYSRYRPRRRKGTVSLVPGTLEYQLPADYQLWLTGLGAYEILDSTLYLDVAVVAPVDVNFNYFATHVLETIPDRDIPIVMDYFSWKFMDNIARDGSDISGLKLGKGLEIKFDNFDEIRQLAEMRLKNYLRAVKRPVGGGT